MNKSICTTIRRQLDEMKLDEPLGLDVSRHLSECTVCREFHDKQTRLRRITGSLGTVSAPPDFDFRLRSRLADEISKRSHQTSYRSWLFGHRGAAVAAAVVVTIVGSGILVRQIQNRNHDVPVASVENGPRNSSNVIVESAQPDSVQNQVVTDTAEVKKERGGEKEKVAKRYSSVPVRNNRQVVSEDLASSRATLIRAPQQTMDPVFPINASQQSLKLSLFDSRGNPRTISLPAVTFGSQRVVPTATSYAPKGVW